MESIRFPSYGSDLDQSIATIIKGFRAVQKTIGSEGDAISFAFPVQPITAKESLETSII